jgi:hypothetical protein
MVRLHLLAEAEWSQKVINPKHWWSIGADPRLNEYPAGFFPEEPMIQIVDGHINPYRKMHKLPAGHRMCELPGFVRDVQQQARQMQRAVQVGCWADVPEIVPSNPAIWAMRNSTDYGRYGLRSHMWCPFSGVMAVAQDTQDNQAFHIPARWRVADKLKETLTVWITEYVKKVDMWCPQLLLFPFASGDLIDGFRGPALAKALLQAGCVGEDNCPRWLRDWRPASDLDLEAESIVHKSIIAAGVMLHQHRTNTKAIYIAGVCKCCNIYLIMRH